MYQWSEGDYDNALGDLEQLRDLYPEGSLCYGMISGAVEGYRRSQFEDWFWQDDPSQILDDNGDPAAGATILNNGSATRTEISWYHPHHWSGGFLNDANIMGTIGHEAYHWYDETAPEGIAEVVAICIENAPDW